MIKKVTAYILGILVFASVFTSCKKDYLSIAELDSQAIQDYIQKNSLNMTKFTYNDTSEFFYQVITPGTGPVIEYSQTVPLVFTIKSLDNQYASVDTFSAGNRYADYLGYFNLEPVRLAVKEVLTRRNGKVRILVPSRFAFGRNGNGSVPGNASLDISINVLDESKMAAYQDFVIEQYLQKNNLSGFTRTSSGLYYKISVPGAGSPITPDSTVTAKYTGRYLNGKEFDKSTDGTSFQLSGTIKGWQEGVSLLKEGGSMRLIVPSSLGYGFSGERGRGIPPFSPLDFDIQITEVKK